MKTKHSSAPVAPAPVLYPGTRNVETLEGPVTRINSFPTVKFNAPIGQPVSADMRAATTSVTPNADADGYHVIGVVDIGGVIVSAEELEALPGFTEFFPALLQLGLDKLAVQDAIPDNELPPPEPPPAADE